MKAKELIEQLQKLDPETLMVVRGYEGGYSIPQSTKLINITGPHDNEWYYGNYNDCDKDDPEKIKGYKNLLNKIREREEPNQKLDYLGRESARRDKYFIPSHRTSSFPELSGIKTVTKSPKKLRKQKAIGEIT